MFSSQSSQKKTQKMLEEYLKIIKRDPSKKAMKVEFLARIDRLSSKQRRIELYFKLATIYLPYSPKEAQSLAVKILELDSKNKNASNILRTVNTQTQPREQKSQSSSTSTTHYNRSQGTTSNTQVETSKQSSIHSAIHRMGQKTRRSPSSKKQASSTGPISKGNRNFVQSEHSSTSIAPSVAPRKRNTDVGGSSIRKQNDKLEKLEREERKLTEMEQKTKPSHGAYIPPASSSAVEVEEVTDSVSEYMSIKEETNIHRLPQDPTLADSEPAPPPPPPAPISPSATTDAEDLELSSDRNTPSTPAEDLLTHKTPPPKPQELGDDTAQDSQEEIQICQSIICAIGEQDIATLAALLAQSSGQYSAKKWWQSAVNQLAVISQDTPPDASAQSHQDRAQDLCFFLHALNTHSLPHTTLQLLASLESISQLLDLSTSTLQELLQCYITACEHIFNITLSYNQDLIDSLCHEFNLAQWAQILHLQHHHDTDDHDTMASPSELHTTDEPFSA